MFHYLTIGHFDPDLIYPWRRLSVERPLTPDEISAVEHAVEESVGHPVDLGAALQPNGVLRILWLGDRRQAAIARAVADAAHRLLGAVAADREHAEVVVPGRRGPPWPRLTLEFVMEGRARELIVDRPIGAEDIAALKRVASEACGRPAGLYLTEKSYGAYIFCWLGEPGAEAILSAAERLFGTLAREIPASRRPWG
ncbi:hypothetical protein [Sorangium sp. So ce385]|uniref:hypothetical protein n=1 Tax=Sorangium sp. So ce385 TaxID=3133308 RepID=UPI003F5C4F7F